jgi:hypothetical protein
MYRRNCWVLVIHGGGNVEGTYGSLSSNLFWLLAFPAPAITAREKSAAKTDARKLAGEWVSGTAAAVARKAHQ